jgi:hypothetical protein
VTALRRKGTRGGVLELIKEFSLSSQERVALMCLAEALLRIPDAATRDALIRDKIGGGNWRSVVGPSRFDRPCRIYAPVGTHETLLAYLVRRLLENGANSSFVNRIQDPAVPLADLVADPVSQVTGCVPVGAQPIGQLCTRCQHRLNSGSLRHPLR